MFLVFGFVVKWRLVGLGEFGVSMELGELINGGYIG